MKLVSTAIAGTVGLVVVCCAMILIAVVWLVGGTLSDNVETGMRAVLDREIAEIAARIDAIRQDATELAEGPILQRFLMAPTGGAKASERRLLEARFATVLRSHPAYFQIRFLDIQGQEVARVERVGDRLRAAAPAMLQDKSGRDYVSAIRELAPHSSHIGQIDLNREFGQIEMPIRPTARIVVPVFDATGTRRGGVVFNLNAASVLPPPSRGGLGFIVVNQKGDYLLHPDRGREFSLELGGAARFPEDFGLAATDPSLASERVQRFARSGSEGAVLAAHGWFRAGARDNALAWLVLAVQPHDVALAPVVGQMRTLAMVVAGLAALASLVGWFAVRRVTEPVAAVARAARRVAGGELGAEVKISGADEIEDLAVAFNLMSRELARLLAREAEVKALMRAANGELKRSNSELENFSRVVSHDLRTPLRALGVLPDWIEEDLPDMPEPIRGYLDEMRDQVKRMEAMTDGLLHYSMLGSEMRTPTQCDLAKIAANVLSLIRVPDGFVIDQEFDAAVVEAVPTEIEIILRNLVQNALHHHDRDAGRITIRSRFRGDEVEIDVMDDGPGIPTAFQQRVLEPLVSLGGEGKGTGLGLAFVNKIAQRWNGRVEIVSDIATAAGEDGGADADGKRGTVIRVILPRRPVRRRSGADLSAMLAA